MPITNLTEQLKRDEGFKLQLYLDGVNKTSIGVGRNLSDVGISEEEAEFLLANDIRSATASLEKAFPWTSALDEVRRAVLINMTFNMGIKGLAGFRNFLERLEARDYIGAAAEMLDSKWAKQVGARATRLSIQLESGVWQ